MGALCIRDGPQVYEESKDLILAGVRSNLERQQVGEAAGDDKKKNEALMNKLKEVIVNFFYVEFLQTCNHKSCRFNTE